MSITWKIEKKALQGLDTWVITSQNGVSRFATEVEVDMWTQILALTKTKTDMVEMLNKFGFKIEGIVKEHTGKGITDPDKLKSEAKKAEDKKAEEAKAAKAKADEKAKVEKAVASTTTAQATFGKRDTAPETSTLTLKERLLGKHRDKLKSSASAPVVGGMAGPTGKLPG